MNPQVVCPLCGGRTEGVHQAREMMLGRRDPFSYGECADCGTLVLLDPPDDPAAYYPGDYYSLSPPPPSPAPVRLLKRVRGAAAARGHRRLATVIGGGSAPLWMDWLQVAGLDGGAAICDIGCGRGDLLIELADAGFSSPVGVDPMIERSVDRDGIRIHKATARELAEASNPASMSTFSPSGEANVDMLHGRGGSLDGTADRSRFDLVMFNHSFEHLADPLADLAAAHELLAPAGTVMIRTPIAGCWAWRHYGTDWVALDPPRHLFVATTEGLKAAAAACGLEVYATRYDSTEMQFWRSEQYQRDIALFEPGSHQVDPAGSQFSPAELREWRRRAEQLNREDDGDTAAIFLRRPDESIIAGVIGPGADVADLAGGGQ